MSSFCQLFASDLLIGKPSAQIQLFVKDKIRILCTFFEKMSQCLKHTFILHWGLVVQFVAESRFANCEFANLFFDFNELQFS